jgi:cystathionine beta-lyase/cystathionine gamma-synthase
VEKFVEVQRIAYDCLDFEVNEGDLVFIECPQNATCIVPNIPAFAEKAHEKGAILVVDR